MKSCANNWNLNSDPVLLILKTHIALGDFK